MPNLVSTRAPTTCGESTTPAPATATFAFVSYRIPLSTATPRRNLRKRTLGDGVMTDEKERRATTDDLPALTRHPQTEIAHNTASALVDTDIAPLILALWRHNITTNASCQGDSQRTAYISFSSGADADRFVALVHPWRLACELHPGQPPQASPWRWRANQTDDDVVWVHVAFPADELPAITAAAEQPDTRTPGEWAADHDRFNRRRLNSTAAATQAHA